MTSRLVPLDEWGKRLLEELLFQAAEQAGAAAPGTDVLTVNLSFTLRAHIESECIEVSVPGAVESELVTQLPRPF
jgi:hypothetical protein